MSWSESLLVLLAGVAAGTVNAVVGSGSLITFPTLLALGVSPVTANVSNNIGLVAGGISGTWGYRRELVGQGRRVRQLLPWSLGGGAGGALLLLWLPSVVFQAVVPVLIGVGVLLVVAQPWLAGSRPTGDGAPDPGSRPRQAALRAGVLGTGVYGGYFGAAQGILLIGVLGALVAESPQRLNGMKNVLAAAVNTVAAAVFTTVAADRVDWSVAAAIACGSLVGGLLGARFGRRLPPRALRGFIVVVGIVAIIRILAG
ncbi:MAG: sulfite exporter TauE/SafE family protein [Angustibacter sp.]